MGWTATAGSAAADLQQVVALDRRERQRLVADLLEEDDDAVVLHPHDHAGAPLGVHHRGLGRERGVGVPAGGLLVGGAGRAVVAVAALLLELLAEEIGRASCRERV